ncbi:hypothetical protein [Streptomyces sp. NPDC090056]|uniref:hypothetical protein n=1 Tax=Streptomyces sp. NPDC090056 TaxID=3365934 RepID=UPI00381241AF
MAVVVGVPVVVGGAGSIIGGILSDQGLLPGDSIEAFSGSAVERRSPDFPDPAGPQWRPGETPAPPRAGQARPRSVRCRPSVRSAGLHSRTGKRAGLRHPNPVRQPAGGMHAATRQAELARRDVAGRAGFGENAVPETAVRLVDGVQHRIER